MDGGGKQLSLAGGNVGWQAVVEARVGRRRAAAPSRFELLAPLEPYRPIIEYFLVRRNLANQLAKTQLDSHNPGLRRLSIPRHAIARLPAGPRRRSL